MLMGAPSAKDEETPATISATTFPNRFVSRVIMSPGELDAASS